MQGKPAPILLVFLLLASTIVLAHNIQPVKSDYAWTETIYIQADGSVSPSTAPISSVDNMTYTLTDNIVGNLQATAIVIQRDNIIVDGAAHTIQIQNAMGSEGVDLTGRSNVTIKNMKIIAFHDGIYLGSSSNNSVSGNSITAGINGIYLYYSSNNSVSGNNITASYWNGIYLYYSSNNSVSGNNITASYLYGILFDYSSNNSVSGNSITASNGYGILFDYSSSGNSVSGNNIVANDLYGIYLDSSSSNNSVSGNNIANNGFGIYFDSSSNNNVGGNNITANNDYGIYLYYSPNNNVSGNNIANNGAGIWLYYSSTNKIYHNNFINNINQVVSSGSTNVWDNGYPSGGNYWSDNAGVDLYNGPYQNQTGNDGIGDTPYLIDMNRDNYPLMKPWTDIGVTSVTVSKSFVGQGYNASISVVMFNYGFDAEIVNVTAYGNATIPIGSQNVTLPSGSFTIGTFTWNTTGKGNYTISGYALPVPGETNTADNNFTGGWIKVTIVGDVNGDGKVNLIDVFSVALAFGSEPGRPTWNPNYDINNDQKINLIDYFITALNFGKTDP
jgi:parallel beta-helix repeat protein